HACLFAATATAVHGRCEVDFPFRLLDSVDLDLDRVAEAVRPASAAGERRPEAVRLEVVAAESSRGQEPFEHRAEPHEQAGADQSDDLALPLRLPSALEQLVL